MRGKTGHAGEVLQQDLPSLVEVVVARILVALAGDAFAQFRGLKQLPRQPDQFVGRTALRAIELARESARRPRLCQFRVTFPRYRLRLVKFCHGGLLPAVDRRTKGAQT